MNVDKSWNDDSEIRPALNRKQCGHGDHVYQQEVGHVQRMFNASSALCCSKTKHFSGCRKIGVCPAHSLESANEYSNEHSLGGYYNPSENNIIGSDSE